MVARRPGAVDCRLCERSFVQRDGIVRCLSAEREAELDAFFGQYRTVRAKDGYRHRPPEYYRSLPEVADADAQATVWRLRRASFARLRRDVLDRRPTVGTRVLDAGAGNGWLSHQLTALGYHAVALDCLDDAEDGLGAARHYDARFVCVQGHFDEPPFAHGQFDVVIFNGSLHYSSNVARTLSHAVEQLAPQGTLVVMDSPMFERVEDGGAMLARKELSFRTEYGVERPVRPGVGFLTFDDLRQVADTLDLTSRFRPSSAGLLWTARRMLAAWKIGRQPAGFGVWVAQ